MNIAYTLNDKFVPQVAASICSICENNCHNQITFYLVVDNVSPKNQQALNTFVQGYGQKLTIIEIKDLKQFFNFDFDTTGWSSIVLARLVLDKLLPDHVDRVLYLDGDTIVRSDLKGFYDTDMGKMVIGASIEPTADYARKQSLGIRGAYYNAGVLLINLRIWRQNKIGQKILTYYAKHNGRLFANDQDAINGALKEEIYTLAPKYNFCNIYYQYPYRFLRKLAQPAKYFSAAEFKDSIKNPVIIHFLGEERPWRAGNHHKYRDDYKKNLALTPWKDTPDENGWRTYFICWYTFNATIKLFPALRHKIITSLIPFFINARAKQNRQPEKSPAKTAQQQKQSPKVSILIPAYNAENTICKTIDSVLAQTYPNIEVLVVNDGSTDGTWPILQDYQQRYPKTIKIFSQKNKGLGPTRNTLLKKATGDYIVNLDSDDWLKVDYIQTMSAANKDQDIVICGFERYDADYQFRDKRTPKPGNYAKYRLCTTAGKMFRKTFLNKNHLQYHAINMGEDAQFNILAYAKTNKIITLPYSGYCCYENAHSMAHNTKYAESRSFYTLMKNTIAQLKGNAILQDSAFQFFVLKNLLMDIFLYKNDLSAKRLSQIYHKSLNWYKQFLSQNNSKFKTHFQKGEAILINFVVNGFIILTKLHLEDLALRILKKVPVNIL